MHERLHLGVRNRLNGEYYVVGCTLPAQIGRMPVDDNQVLLDAQYQRISRVHCRIEKTSRGYQYVDTSKVGSRVAGAQVTGTRAPLQGDFNIEIEGYTITKVEVTPFIVLQTDGRAITQQKPVDLLPGRGLGITAGVGAPRLVALDRYDMRSYPLVGHFEVADDVPVWVFDPSAGVDVLRNKARITQRRTLLASLDVVEVGGQRFEFLHPHHGRIVCGFASCNLLNPPPLAGNCRFCGHDLAGAGGFSRVIT
jgi:hypothetical protein